MGARNEDEEIEQKRKMEDDAREQQRRDEDDAVDQKRQREDEARTHRHENEGDEVQQVNEGQEDEHSNPEDLKSALQDLEKHMGDSEDKPLVREEQRLVAQAHTKLNARDFENAADLEAQLKDLMQQRQEQPQQEDVAIELPLPPQVQTKRALRGHPAAVNAL